MGSTPKPPAYPDPTQTANTQYGFNVKTGQANQALNMVNQSNPFGSKSYFVSGIDPVTGLPKYEQDINYTPEQQALLESLQGTKANVGQAGESLSGDALSMYSSLPDFSTAAGSRVSQMLDRQMPYWERFMEPARAQLDTALRNQGILPGTPAYQQQVDKLTAQQDLDRGNFLNTAQDQAFRQAMQEYTTPASMISTLMQMGAPNSLGFDQTPSTNLGQTDYAGQVQAKYNAEFQRYQEAVKRQNSMMSGMFGLGGQILGGPMGGMLGNYMGNMFSGGPSTLGPWETSIQYG